MAEHKIAVISGDGVGPEVVAEGRKVLEALAAGSGDLGFTFTEFPWGSAYYRETGRMMPEDGLEQLGGHDVILFGAVGDPDIPDHITLQGLLLPMRRAFDQAISIRPCYLHPGVVSPVTGKEAGQIDMVIFRENTEGEYAPVGGRLYPGTPQETVIQTGVFTRHGTERIIRAAFEYCARRNIKNKVTSVTKSNALAFSMVFWDEVFEDVAREYPQIQTESLLVDRASMDLVRWPEDFDVIVASNLFGDILSDIRGGGDRQHGTGGKRQHQPGAAAPFNVRVGARRGIRHCGEEPGQPAGHHIRRGPDAGPLGRERRSPAGGKRRGPQPSGAPRGDR